MEKKKVKVKVPPFEINGEKVNHRTIDNRFITNNKKVFNIFRLNEVNVNNVNMELMGTCWSYSPREALSDTLEIPQEYVVAKACVGENGGATLFHRNGDSEELYLALLA